MPRKKAAATPVNDLSAWDSEIDLEATQELIDQLQAEGKNWDKLEIGQKKYKANYRRICPKRPDWQNPYQITPIHYLGPNRRMVICLKESGLGDCPACQLRWELHEADAEAEARSLRHSVRTFLNVVHVDKNGELEDDKVYLLGLNQLQFIGKRGVEYDPDEEGDLPLYNFFTKYGDLSSVSQGRNLLIKAKEEKSGDFDTTASRTAIMSQQEYVEFKRLVRRWLKARDRASEKKAAAPYHKKLARRPADKGCTLFGLGDGLIAPGQEEDFSRVVYRLMEHAIEIARKPRPTLTVKIKWKEAT